MFYTVLLKYVGNCRYREHVKIVCLLWNSAHDIMPTASKQLRNKK